MPTPSERNALLFVAAALLLGAGVRTVRSFQGAPDSGSRSRSALSGQIAAVERARADRAAGKVASRTTHAIDINNANLVQLQSLPRVGPVLAQRIKSYRDSAGPFASLEQLDKVKGIGPAMLKELAPRVTFSPSRRHRDAPSF